MRIVLPPEFLTNDGVGLVDHERAVRETDHLPDAGPRTAALGLFGEVGSLLSALKKSRRDAAAFADYDDALLEEFGDVMWYWTAVALRAGFEPRRLVREALSPDARQEFSHRDTWRSFQDAVPQARGQDAFAAMARLAEQCGVLIGALGAEPKIETARLEDELIAIIRALAVSADVMRVSLDEAARRNLEKIYSRYPRVFNYPTLPDVGLPINERLPRRFELFIGEHDVNGRTYVIQTCNGVIVGDRLTDNKAEPDDYRFHDVFHVAYAVHLGWSPILRRLFRVKRKSSPVLDESEDGARAGLLEEGIATFIFGRALERNLFEGLERLDFDLLKVAQGFVRGYESERCTMWQWERAILDGYRMFRALKRQRRGAIVADLEAHTLEFRSANLALQGSGHEASAPAGVIPQN